MYTLKKYLGFILPNRFTHKKHELLHITKRDLSLIRFIDKGYELQKNKS